MREREMGGLPQFRRVSAGSSRCISVDLWPVDNRHFLTPAFRGTYNHTWQPVGLRRCYSARHNSKRDSRLCSHAEKVHRLQGPAVQPCRQGPQSTLQALVPRFLLVTVEPISADAGVHLRIPALNSDASDPTRPMYHVFFLTALLPWNWNPASVRHARSIVNNGHLIKKIFFSESTACVGRALQHDQLPAGTPRALALHAVV